jgi:hypothetical protein
MQDNADNETWVLERGAQIIEKRVVVGDAALNEWERLVYRLWVTDYMMRNAGDFANAKVMLPTF